MKLSVCRTHQQGNPVIQIVKENMLTCTGCKWFTICINTWTLFLGKYTTYSSIICFQINTFEAHDLV